MTRGIRDEDYSDSKPSGRPDGVTISVSASCLFETVAAIRVGWHDGDQPREHWIPKSVLDDDSEVFAKGHTGKLIVAAWFARQEGLSDE